MRCTVVRCARLDRGAGYCQQHRRDRRRVRAIALLVHGTPAAQVEAATGVSDVDALAAAVESIVTADG